MIAARDGARGERREEAEGGGRAEEARRHRGAASRCDTRLSTPVEARRRHLRKPPDPDLVAELARVLAAGHL